VRQGRGPVGSTITEVKKLAGKPLRITASRALSSAERTEVKRGLSRMLRLDEDEAHIAAFHKADKRWKRSGRGRLMRSPMLFEDIIKTVTSCNVTWPSTVTMNRRLCEVLGKPLPKDDPSEGQDARGPFRHTFPDARKIARTRATTLRGRCRVGYRDQRIVELARLLSTARTKQTDPQWMEDPNTPDNELHDALLELPGIGPYAAANIMQLLGRYNRLPLDTESVRHGRVILGFSGKDAHVMKQVARHFEPFGADAFRSYWIEMWVFYESKRGPAWTWDREDTGSSFTAAQL
jgi:3-methyladenine DNA glycosylase/8-oxoguanine DNA glycosylase